MEVMDKANDDKKQSQEILVEFWGLLMIILVVLFTAVMYQHYKNDKLLKKKLYNFKKAPKNYVDDDSFINNHDVWSYSSNDM